MTHRPRHGSIWHRLRSAPVLAAALIPALGLLLSSCGGGGGSSAPTPDPIPSYPLPTERISADSPVAAGCTGGSTSGQLYANAEVEPFAAVHPGNGAVLLAAWQQDRWSDGGARALVSAVSGDGGASWSRTLMPFSRCGGALSGSAGDYQRASDPWVDISPDGVMHAMALAFSGAAQSPGSASAMLASRSLDGGRSWSPPQVLQRDGEALFNDKNALSADPADARYVYAVWDRLDAAGNGPTLLARSVNGGASWEPARIIHAPTVAGGVSQTLGNRIVVRPDGLLLNLFTQIDTVAGQSNATLMVQRSADKGASWSAPIHVSDVRAVGARDPQTGKAIRDGATLAALSAAPDGSVWVVWQDARFSGGLRDGIALSRSLDGGLSWSAPVAINRSSASAAFTPAIAVRADGLVGVLHYDLRADTADASTLLASAWLLSSRDGVNWVETPVFGPFDMAGAPDARGLFLGDYQGLVAQGTGFLPVLALARRDASNPTDIFAPRIVPVASAQAAAADRLRARRLDAGSQAINEADWQRASQQAIVATMERRRPGWARLVGARTEPP